MAGTSFESSPTPSRAFPALKTPPPGLDDSVRPGVQDRLDRLLSRSTALARRTDGLNALADAVLAEIAALPAP
jgi:hypothetical protein